VAHLFRPALALSLLLLAVSAWAAESLADRLRQAREAAAVVPQRGLALLTPMRSEAIAARRLDERLAVDEAECRIAGDMDAVQALAVADAGLAAAGAADEGPPGEARPWWLRLRACRAGMLVELGHVEQARTEFEVLLALTADPALAVPRALARLERGVHRSRSGDLQRGQADLLAACEVLGRTGPDADRDLCRWHLAGHYKRIGDLDESLRLMKLLQAGARARAATYDESIFAYGLAQAYQVGRRWEESLSALREARTLSEKLADRGGMAYAEYGLANSLLELKQPRDALVHADNAMRLLDARTDPRQYEVQAIAKAEALTGVGRAGEAVALLDAVDRRVRDRGDLLTLASHERARGAALAATGRWAEAYRATESAASIDRDLAQKRQSDQAARMRQQFNRDRDGEDLATLRQLHEQELQLRQTQAVALALFVVLLGVLAAFAVRKVMQARRLQRLASTDELTGLPNRRATLAFLDDALARARRDRSEVAVLMIDVDHFKRINDTWGHATGDDVLRHLARVLGGGLRDRDRLGRLGGEEFLAVLPGAGADVARGVAERMRAAIAGTPMLGSTARAIAYTVSIGAAVDDGVQAAGALLARADAALYQAKGAGRNTVVLHAGPGAVDDPQPQGTAAPAEAA
jgi:diguanylate cyclase (GGDEF)-like protein